MARPSKGNVVLRPGGRFQASVPVEPGSVRRHYEMFDTKAQANAWCALAVANLAAGLPLPSRDAVLGDGDPSRRARTPSARPPVPDARVRLTVEQVTDAWFHEVYVDGRSGGAGRANSVRAMLNRRVVPFLSPIFDAGRPLTREAYRTYLGDLGRPSQVHHTGQRGPKTREGLSQETLSDVRRCLDAVIKLGFAMRAWEVSFDLADVRTPRSRRKASPKAAGVSIGEVARIAEHMHAVHQVTLWTCRILTLRLGEAYGLRVEDLKALNDGTGRGLLWLHAQGGRRFHEFDGDRIVRTNHKEGMKHGYSERMQLVPAQLMRLYEHVIDVFHTDSATGEVDVAARLVPSMVIGNAGGQETFRMALKKAAAAAGVVTVTLNGFTRKDLRLPNPKDLRSSAVTDLEWVPGLDPTALRRYAGHAPGTDVHALHYVGDQPVNEKMVRVCQAMEALIARALLGGLLIPTSRRCTTGAQPLLRARAADIETGLREHGWLLTAADEAEDPWLTVEEIAELLGQGRTTIRRWLQEGRFETSLSGAKGGIRRGNMIRRSAVLTLHQDNVQLISLTDMEERTGVSYHRLYNWIRRFDLEVEPGGERLIYLPESTVTEMERLVAMERELQKMGMSFGDAANKLGVQSRTIDSRVKMGLLDELPDCGPDGTRYVTRGSVQKAIAQPDLMTRRRPKRRGR